MNERWCALKMDKKETLLNLKNNEKNMYFIHYSCESLNDANEGYSPRITSIAVLHLPSRQMSSFSLHLIAEELHISRENICENYNKIETILLKRFFSFASKRGDSAIWMHWNMININFGFETLEHRYRVLCSGEPYHIRENARYNISDLLRDKYGNGYAKDPKMLNLMELNGEKHREFLTGSEEVTAFKAGEFVKMHNSTMRKVFFFAEVYQRMQSNKLRTETNQFRYKLNELSQHPVTQIISIIGILGSLASLVVSFFG